MPSKKVLKKSLESEVLDCLKEYDSDNLLSTLSENGRDKFYKIISEIKNDKTSKELDNLWSLDYSKKPPTIDEFIKDSYWLGETLCPREDNAGIYPIWQQVLNKDFDLNSRVHNVVITGSLGIGKTYIMAAIFLYKFVCAYLLKNPQNFFGLSKNSQIVYAVLSVTKQTVKQTIFKDLLNYMSLSTFFIEECKFNPKQKYASQEIDLGKNILLTAGSKSQHIVGRNTLGIALDEGNWRIEKNPDVKAYELYDEIRTRIKNRFQKTAGFLPAISILASSSRDESSFTENVIKEIALGDQTTQKVYRYSVYEVRKHASKYKSRRFKVAYGLKNIDPIILKGWYDSNGNRISEEYEEPPKGCKIELVPEDFIEEFKRNCKVALQGLSGISSGGSHKLFSSLVDVEDCLELSISEGVVNPSLCDLIPISLEDDKEVWDYLDHKSFLVRKNGVIKPKRHPESFRFIHIDNATRNRAGISVCHLVRYEKVEGLVNQKDGSIFEEARLIAEYDFTLGIIAGKMKPISLEKVLRFVLWLRDKCNFSIKKVTADQYQSTMQLQMLESRGVEIGNTSVDRDKKPYYAWRSAFEEKRLRLYRNEKMLEEMEKLLDLPDKINHPTENDFKDISDSAAASYWNAINSDESYTESSECYIGPHNGEDEIKDMHDFNFPAFQDKPNKRVHIA